MVIALEKGGGGTILVLMWPYSSFIISSFVTAFFGLNNGADGITALTLAPYTCSGGWIPFFGGAGSPIAFENGGGGAILAFRFFFIN